MEVRLLLRLPKCVIVQDRPPLSCHTACHPASAQHPGMRWGSGTAGVSCLPRRNPACGRGGLVLGMQEPVFPGAGELVQQETQ